MGNQQLLLVSGSNKQETASSCRIKSGSKRTQEQPFACPVIALKLGTGPTRL
jgi:hypothetical protein